MRSRFCHFGSLTYIWKVLFGYICGITGKLIAPTFKWYVLFFYVLNFIMVSADLILYFRNKKLDAQRENSNV